MIDSKYNDIALIIEIHEVNVTPLSWINKFEALLVLPKASRVLGLFDHKTELSLRLRELFA